MLFKPQSLYTTVSYWVVVANPLQLYHSLRAKLKMPGPTYHIMGSITGLLFHFTNHQIRQQVTPSSCLAIADSHFFPSFKYGFAWVYIWINILDSTISDNLDGECISGT